MKCASLVFLLLPLLAASTSAGAIATPTPAIATNLNEIAEAYVKLVLAMGQHDPDYVDAYYGPPEWKKQAKKPLEAIALEAVRLRDQLGKIPKLGAEMERLRNAHLTKQLAAHEGYPGHHVYNVLLEKNLLQDRGWIEFSV